MTEQKAPYCSCTSCDCGKGLYGKYILYKADTREEVTEDYFVLRPDRDPAAIFALLAYAEATDNKKLAKDLAEWVIALTSK